MTYVDEYREALEPDLDVTIYVSGPISGKPGHNFQAFNEAEAHLREMGYWDIINPASTGIMDSWNWADYLRFDIQELMHADAVWRLAGWRESKGARLEVHVAKELGMEIWGADE